MGQAIHPDRDGLSFVSIDIRKLFLDLDQLCETLFRDCVPRAATRGDERAEVLHPLGYGNPTFGTGLPVCKGVGRWTA